MRLFFGLWPPEQVAAVLARWAARTARKAGGRAVAESSIHLTLAFLGDIEEVRLPGAVGAARAVCGAAHFLPIEEVQYWKRNRIIWVGPREMPQALGMLASDLHAALLGAGFSLEKRAFQAHVTLLRKVRAPRRLSPLPAVHWPVGEFVLVNSELSSEGSRYTALERFVLGA